MKFFGKDGGPESTVWGYFLEFKRLFTVAVLRFDGASREAHHSHAFNSISWLFKGKLIEQHLDGTTEVHRPGLRPIITRRSTFHKVDSVGRSWVLTFRGPWARTWQEYINGRFVTLTHGRKPA